MEKLIKILMGEHNRLWINMINGVNSDNADALEAEALDLTIVKFLLQKALEFDDKFVCDIFLSEMYNMFCDESLGELVRCTGTDYCDWLADEVYIPTGADYYVH